MSITCSCLVLFLLCLSLHACNARRDLDRYKTLQKPRFFSDKGHEEISIPIERSGDQANTAVKIKNDKLKKVGRSAENVKGKGFSDNKTKSHRTKKSRDSTTWRVPHKKRGEKQPGFNLDYSPPKTHPPSHN